MKLPPIHTTEKQMVSTSKKPNSMSQNVPSVPPIPARDLLSQPSGEGRIEEITETGSDDDIEDLQ